MYKYLYATMSKISLIFGLAVYGFRASTILSIEVLAETFFEMTLDCVNICNGDAINENLEECATEEGIGTHLPLATSILFKLSEYFCINCPHDEIETNQGHISP